MTRTVHAVLADGAEIVRYDDGTWAAEWPGRGLPMQVLRMDQAAWRASAWDAMWTPGLPGGRVFDARVRRCRAERESTPAGLS